jgi:hypothetical protein
MDRDFTTPELAEALNLPMRKILSYVERGYVRPSVLDASGHGSRRLWALWDLDKIHLLRRCEQLGLSVRLLRLLGAALIPPFWPDVVLRKDSVGFIVMNERGELGDMTRAPEEQVNALDGPCVVIPVKGIVAEVRERLYGGLR